MLRSAIFFIRNSFVESKRTVRDRSVGLEGSYDVLCFFGNVREVLFNGSKLLICIGYKTIFYDVGFALEVLKVKCLSIVYPVVIQVFPRLYLICSYYYTRL